ncbi:MAG: hypothetical protein ABI666_00725 [Ferruginibacter sp.]
MYGKINSPGNYADGQERFEISLYFDEDENFPFEINKRIDCLLTLGDKQYICGIRSTENTGSWISPDIYEILFPSKGFVSPIFY